MIGFPKRIALVGMRGSGKTTLAKCICQKWNLPLLDGDAHLETRLNMSIRDMFEQQGEAWFRDREVECLAEITKGETWVIATGGGVILREENRDCLRKKAVVVWLEATPETLAQRVSGDPRSGNGRPPLGAPFAGNVVPYSTQVRPYEEVYEELAAVLQRRLDLYRNAANIRLDANQGSPEQLLGQLEMKLENRIILKERE